MNICQCGAQPGYQHAPDCPYPLFYDATCQVEKWRVAREQKRAGIARNRYLCQFRSVGTDYFTTDCAFSDPEQAKNYTAQVMAALIDVAEGQVYDQVEKCYL